jgi:CBS domain-containing protein
MSVLELCDREIAAVGMQATVADAIHKMLDRHVGAVAVVDDEYRVAGIFTERDVLRKMSLSNLDPRATSIRELMTTPVEMATRGTGAGEALTIMLERQAAGDSLHPESARVARGRPEPRTGVARAVCVE